MCCEYLSEQSYWWTPVAVRNVMVLERLLVVIARSHGVRILHMPTTARACDCALVETHDQAVSEGYRRVAIQLYMTI